MRIPSLILASRSPRRRQLLAEAGYTFRVVAPEDDVERGICSECSPAELVTESAYRKAAAVRRQLLNPPLPLEEGRGTFLLLPPGEGRAEGALFPPNTEPGDRAIIVAADTIAECDGEILGKPRDEGDARAMLRRLSGRPHRVLTGLCLWPLNLPLPPGEGRGESSTEHGRLNVARAQGESNPPLPPNEGRSEGFPLLRVAVTKLQMDHLTDQQLDRYLATGQWEGKAGAFGYQDDLEWVHVVEGSESNVVGLPMELLAEMLAQL